MAIRTERVEQGIEILRRAIELEESVRNLSKRSGYNKDFVYNIKNDLIEKGITNELEQEFWDLWEQYFGCNTKVEKIAQAVVNEVKNISEKVNVEEKFAKRNVVELIRNEDGKINEYYYCIYIHDQEPLMGYLSREDMERICELYPYNTINETSNHFEDFTPFELKRILHAFNLTKDVKVPPHLIEEQSIDDSAEFALKNKTKQVYKKIAENSSAHFEVKWKKAEQELILLKKNNEFITNTVEKLCNDYLRKEKKVVILKKKIFTKNDRSVYTFFGDVHFGKKYASEDLSMPIRGNNVEILADRLMQVAVETVKKANEICANRINLMCLGDLVESAMPSGMHPEHWAEMDVYGDEQIQAAVIAIENMIDYIIQNTDTKAFINMDAIGGNHDRVGLNRHDDKTRTSSKIIINFVRELIKRKYDSDVVNITYHSNGRIQSNDDGISIIAFHGDNSLAKRKATELMNQFKTGDSENFTVILQGHWHNFNVEEGSKYIKMTVGSVCSPDAYVQDDLGLGCVPSFVIGCNPKDKYGFDFSRITLY